jgi:Cu(I)/Ag(I) efflux system membrane fusion protein
MALDWEGADWLSDREAIRNPYFGDQMLKCGNVTGKIEAD